MPKVTEEHREQMRRRILDAATEACEEIPAYALTMRDVVRKANLSPGAVYSYYSDIDDLWVDFLNRNIPADAAFAGEILRRPEEKLEAYIDRMLEAVALSLQSIPLTVGKIVFELDTKRATHPEFAQKRREKVRVVAQYHAMLNTLSEHIRREAAAKKSKPTIDSETISLFLQTSYDGILRDIILERCYGLKKSASLDEKKLMAALAISIKALLKE